MTPFARGAVIALLLFAACKSTPAPAPSAGPAVSGKRQLAGFNVVEIGGAIGADVTAGPDFSVEVSGDPAAVALVITKVQGETLVVTRERSSGSNEVQGKVHVDIKLPVLRGIEVSGASEAVVSGLGGEGIRVGASGASQLKVKATKGAHLAIDASGASTVEIAGAIDNLVIDVSGASQVRARDLTVRKAVVDVSGASKLELNGQDVSGDASGASSVLVWGGPQRLAVETSGASSVRNMQ
jgi:putative autotransporter adhesin-like protein